MTEDSGMSLASHIRPGTHVMRQKSLAIGFAGMTRDPADFAALRSKDPLDAPR
jgi:hypothetical protein